MTVSVRLTDSENQLLRSYAQLHGITVSELLRQSARSLIEDELDLKAYDAAMAEYQRDPVTFSLDEVESQLRAAP